MRRSMSVNGSGELIGAELEQVGQHPRQKGAGRRHQPFAQDRLCQRGAHRRRHFETVGGFLDEAIGERLDLSVGRGHRKRSDS